MSPLQRAFNAFLMTMPPEQLEELLKYLQDAKAQGNPQSSYPNENLQPCLESKADKNHGSTIPASANSRSSTSRGKRVSDAKRRPLNSFIAFRSECPCIIIGRTPHSNNTRLLLRHVP